MTLRRCKYCKSVFHKDKSDFFLRLICGTNAIEGEGKIRIFIAMRYVGVYMFLLHLGTVPFYRSNIFRYCGHDVLSRRRCITNAKKERVEARQRKIAAVYRVHWVITRFFRDILDGSSCDTRLIHSSSSNSKMQYCAWNILLSLQDKQFSWSVRVDYIQWYGY